MNLKTGKIYEDNKTVTKKYSTYERWQDNEAERARRRAEYYSKMDYKDFANSEIQQNDPKTLKEVYKSILHLATFLKVKNLPKLDKNLFKFPKITHSIANTNEQLNQLEKNMLPYMQKLEQVQNQLIKLFEILC